MGLTDLVWVLTPNIHDETEDIFSAAPGLLFTSDVETMHGDDRSTLIYKSKRFGDIELRTADPDRDSDNRRLFAHYLWNAGIKLAELISQEESQWSVKDTTVLELGAGVGLNGIVATLAGARGVVISDYPANALLENIKRNATNTIPSLLDSHYRIEGYEWGDVDSQFAAENAHKFTRILAADCYWMPYEHENLVKSMLHFLDMSLDARIFTVSGFHTGRAKLADFYSVAVSQDLEIEVRYEEDVDGVRREWAEERDDGAENVIERKRWLAIAVLRRRAT